MMNQTTLETLVDRWLNDPAFREQVRTDPEAALRATGVELDPDEREALRNVDWNLSDEELALQARDARCG